MELRHNFFLSLGLVIFAASAARADMLELTQEGAQELAKIEQAEAGKFGGRPLIQRHTGPGSQFGFVRGMVIMERSATGDLNFTGPGATELNNEPDKYFKFRPYNWVVRNGNNVNWTDYRFEWKWIAGSRQEIDTLDDLCALVSWRCQPKPGGDPVAAMRTGLQWFVGQLDPSNQLNVGGGGQASTNMAHEGSVTRQLLYGTMSTGERVARVHDCRQQKGPKGQYGNFDEGTQKGGWQQAGVKFSPLDPDWWEETPESVIARLVEAIGRAQKANPQNKSQTLYNVPFSDQIQACARLVGQLLTADLARVPVPAASADAKATRIRAYAFRARMALLAIIEGASPERVVARRQRPVVKSGPAGGAVLARRGETDVDAQLRYTGVDDDMPLTVFDMASAALDILLFDQNGTRSGMTQPFDDDRSRLVGSLLKVAAGAQAFNGGVRNLQVQDSVGYKAINTLALLSEGPVAERFRGELLDTIANPANKMRANAARAAIVRAGVEGPELYRELQALFDIALAANSPEQQQSFYESPPSSGEFLQRSANDPRREDAAYVIKQLARRSNDGARLVRDRLQQLRNRQTSGTGSAEEKKLIDACDKN